MVGVEILQPLCVNKGRAGQKNMANIALAHPARSDQASCGHRARNAERDRGVRSYSTE